MTWRTLNLLSAMKPQGPLVPRESLRRYKLSGVKLLDNRTMRYLVLWHLLATSYILLGQEQFIANSGIEPRSMPKAGSNSIVSCERCILGDTIPGWRSITGIVDHFECLEVTAKGVNEHCAGSTDAQACSSEVFEGCMSLSLTLSCDGHAEYPWPLVENKLIAMMTKGRQYKIKLHLKVASVQNCDTIGLVGLLMWFSTATNTDLDDHLEGGHFLTAEKDAVVVQQEIMIPLNVRTNQSTPWMSLEHVFTAACDHGYMLLGNMSNNWCDGSSVSGFCGARILIDEISLVEL
jgi:hypothetical protein